MALSQFAFAILRPANAVAKISFNTVYETASRHQTAAHSCQMHVKTEQEYDREVFLFRSQQRRKQQLQQTCGDVPEDVMSDTPTEPDTDNEQELRHLGVVWAGYYQFDLDCPPADPQIGWTVGKGREGMSIDFLVTTRNISHEVKGYHARFNLHPNTGYLYISKTSGAVTTKVAVNGNDVSCRQAYALNQTPMNIRMGQLEYTFEYTEIACSDSFYKRREEYMKSHLNGSVPNPSLTPTPAGQARTIGSWTFNASLGRGAFGKVFTATNSRNHVVAIKIVERNSKTANEVEHEIQVLQDLKRLAETENDEGRLVRLRETIYQDGKQEYKSASFEDVALVFEPAAESDFTQLIDTAANQRLQLGRRVQGIAPQAMQLFHDALKGLHFLHSHGWLHGDIKPANIGIIGARAVLLDIGTAIQLRPHALVPPTPGGGGTIWYLAPEREMQHYNYLVDVWSMGVIGYELTYGYHPWKLSKNPWRPGKEHESLRPVFHAKYREASHRLDRDKAITGSQNHQQNKFSALLVHMLRHPWAEGNNGERISAQDALEDPCWQESTDEPPAKRIRQTAP